MLAPLLASKFCPPSLRGSLLVRAQLIARLAAAGDVRLLLIVAPAGFGKTTLLAAWLHERDGDLATQAWQIKAHEGFPPELSETIWLSLDDGDNDPTRFWGYLLAALDRAAPGVGDHARSMLQSPQPPPITVVLAALIDELAVLPGERLLVLDDYHAIRAEPIHAGVAFLLDHLPPGLRLAIASRGEPPLPLARLRLRGQLAELRVDDMRFTLAETIDFLQDRGLALAPADLAELDARLEGWPAALQLAALSLRDSANPHRVITAFAGSNRHLVDYLADEVLRRQPRALQRFLLATSVLDPLCAELCDALLEAEGVAGGFAQGASAQLMLEQIERAGLFLSALDPDRRWYRYHALFAEFLRARLRRDEPTLEAELHRRAADWYAAAGLPIEAVGQLLAAGDDERAAAMIEQQGRPLLLRSEVATVLGWLRALPMSYARSRPGLCLIEAWACAVAGQFDAVDAPLAAAEALLATQADRDLPTALTAPYTPRNLLSEALAVRATVAGLRRDAPRAIALARAALAELPEDSVLVRGVVALMLGTSAYINGDMVAASEALELAAQAGQAGGMPVIAIFALRQLGELHGLVGQLHRAARTFGAAIELGANLYPTRPPQLARPVPVAGAAYIGLGLLRYEWNDLDAAEGLFADGLRLGRQGANVEILLMGPIAMARLQWARGDATTASATMAQALAFARSTGVSRLKDWLAAEQARLALAMGDYAEAVAWDQERNLDLAGSLSYLEEIDYMALAQLRVAQGRPNDARRLLEHMGELAESEGRGGSLIAILALCAVACHAAGDSSAARAALGRAIELAAPEGYCRTFVDLGAPMHALLQVEAATPRAEQRAQPDILPYVAQLLRAFPPLAAETGQLLSSQHALLVEPLTARELEVLALVSAGLANQEIAVQLVVGLSTVKKHINNIYAKLEVSSRTQALRRARELGLLPR